MRDNYEIFMEKGLFGIRNKSNLQVICEPKFEFIKKDDAINITMITFENSVQMYIFIYGEIVIVAGGNEANVNGNLYSIDDTVNICSDAVDSYLSRKKVNINEAADIYELKVDLVNKYNSALERLKMKQYQIDNPGTHFMRK